MTEGEIRREIERNSEKEREIKRWGGRQIERKSEEMGRRGIRLYNTKSTKETDFEVQLPEDRNKSGY